MKGASRARAQASVRKHTVEIETALQETPGRRVSDLSIKQAKKWCADVIMIGTHARHGLPPIVMGSDAKRVLHEKTRLSPS